MTAERLHRRGAGSAPFAPQPIETHGDLVSGFGHTLLSIGNRCIHLLDCAEGKGRSKKWVQRHSSEHPLGDDSETRVPKMLFTLPIKELNNQGR